MAERPPITEEMRAHARVQPDSWLYVLDPTVDPDGVVPPELVVGAYPVDSRGELGEDFEHNPDYRAGRTPEPADPLEAALHDLSAGRGSHEAVLALLRTSELLLQDTVDAGLALHTTAHGRDVVQAWTSIARTRPGDAPTGWQRLRGSRLARMLPRGVDLQLNPGTAVAVTIPRDSLLR